MRVSVVIPAYNAARFLPAALASVAAQTRAADEVIVVDDGSTDSTLERLREWPAVRVVEQPNAGPAAARNTGVAHATGELVAFLDADCVWYPRKLELQVALHEAGEGVDFSFSEVEERVQEGMEAPFWSLQRQLHAGGRFRIIMTSLIIRRSVFVDLGGFVPTLRTGEDTELFARLRGLGYREGHLDEVLGSSLIHGGNLTTDRERIARDLPKALHAALRARRRAAAPTVSALMCVRNGERYLAEALDSVVAQSHPPHEILVVDDGSSDASAAIAARYAPRVTLIASPPLGIGAARQRLVEAARGDVLAFLDADDVWSPTYLEEHLQRLLREGEIDATLSTVQPFLSPELSAEEAQPAAEALTARRGMLIGAMVMRREAVLRVGAFDPERPFTEQDWMMRAVDAGWRFADVPDAVLHRRIHTMNYTLTHGRAWHGRLAALKRGLDRRRAASVGEPGEEGSR
jgi:glycosyltransferase involved in cell wall biosynthesis